MRKEQFLKPRRWFRRWPFSILLALLVLAIVLCGLPFCIPLSCAASLPADLPFANSFYAIVDDVALHYRIWEPPAENVIGKVLLVHGLGGSTFSWEHTARTLSEAGYWVVAADLPGFGFSSRQTGLDHSQEHRSSLLWHLLSLILDKVPDKVQEDPWVLIGHSMGAGTVAAMAVAEPSATARLVFVDGALLDNPPEEPAALVKFPPAARWMAVILEKLVINRKNIQSILSSAYQSTPTEAQTDGYLQPLQLAGSARCFIDIVKTSKNISVELLADAKFPIDAIWGDQDTFVPVSQAAALQKLLPKLELHVLAGAAHMPMETHPIEFSQILLDLLSGIP